MSNDCGTVVMDGHRAHSNNGIDKSTFRVSTVTQYPKQTWKHRWYCNKASLGEADQTRNQIGNPEAGNARVEDAVAFKGEGAVDFDAVYKQEDSCKKCKLMQSISEDAEESEEDSTDKRSPTDRKRDISSSRSKFRQPEFNMFLESISRLINEVDSDDDDMDDDAVMPPLDKSIFPSISRAFSHDPQTPSLMDIGAIYSLDKDIYQSELSSNPSTEITRDFPSKISKTKGVSQLIEDGNFHDDHNNHIQTGIETV